ncbi:MAG: hydroxymethylglutaryl-CoA lyase [Sphingomonadales bacterium]|nr:hydroxymethylglutaryl-CoA lyase [Sphingomonadales bacterium]
MSTVEIVEVGPRDGLQNEPDVVSTENKIELINRAIDAGVRRIEVASFVHPKLVPQMADAEAVIAGLAKRDDVTYIGLVLNKRGYMRAVESGGIDEVGCVAVASDGFGQKNQGQTSQESVDVSKEIIRLAKRDGLSAQVTISTAFGCPFDGPTDPQRVVDMVKDLAEENPREIAIADTIGVASPYEVTRLIAMIKDAVPDVTLRAHFHNTRNTGIANAWAAYEAGVHILDASIGGLGGCPFAPKATGNIATEDLAYMLKQSGVESGLDMAGLISTVEWLEGMLGRKTSGMVAQAGDFPA